MIILEAKLIQKRDAFYFAGYSGYVLGLALLESLLLLLFIVLLSYLFPKNWSGQIPLAVAGALALVVGFWAIANQAYFYFYEQSPGWFSWIMLRVHYRQGLVYPLLVASIAASAAAPVYALSQREKPRKAFVQLMENISNLSFLYLALDLAGILIVLWRNLY